MYNLRLTVRNNYAIFVFTRDGFRPFYGNYLNIATRVDYDENFEKCYLQMFVDSFRDNRPRSSIESFLFYLLIFVEPYEPPVACSRGPSESVAISNAQIVYSVLGTTAV